jgi:hypothetical protein
LVIPSPFRSDASEVDPTAAIGDLEAGSIKDVVTTDAGWSGRIPHGQAAQ